MPKSTERKGNFDLMRIFCILLIVMFHYTCHGNFLYENYRHQKLLLYSTGIWGLLGVICFIMVSSHFLYKKGTFSIQKVVRIIFETSFYSFIITFIIYILGIADIKKSYIIKSIFSVFFKQYWFITDYLIFYMLSPFLKVLCNNIKLENQRLLLIVLFIITFIINKLTRVTLISTIGIFIYTYILISYFIKKPDNFFQKHYKILSVISFAFTIILVCTLIYANKLTSNELYLKIVSDISSISSPLIYLCSICVYYIFKNIEINYSKLFFYISNSTLGIYLIHEHDYFHYILFDNIFKRNEIYSSPYFFVIYVLSCIVILIGCSIIYNIFNFIFGKTIYKLEDKLMKKKYTSFNNKYVPR